MHYSSSMNPQGHRRPQRWNNQSLSSSNDLGQLLSEIRKLAEMGDQLTAMQKLAQLQTLVESLDSTPRQMSPEQQLALQILKNIQDLITNQKQLLDQSFQAFQEQTKQQQTDEALSSQQQNK